MSKLFSFGIAGIQLLCLSPTYPFPASNLCLSRMRLTCLPTSADGTCSKPSVSPLEGLSAILDGDGTLQYHANKPKESSSLSNLSNRRLATALRAFALIATSLAPLLSLQ